VHQNTRIACSGEGTTVGAERRRALVCGGEEDGSMAVDLLMDGCD
jgi:hypothetical protein